MIISSYEGGEQFDENRVISAIDRRHPTQADLQYLLNTELTTLKLRTLYEQGRLATEAFFAAGHPRPEHGDESY